MNIKDKRIIDYGTAPQILNIFKLYLNKKVRFAVEWNRLNLAWLNSNDCQTLMT